MSLCLCVSVCVVLSGSVCSHPLSACLILVTIFHHMCFMDKFYVGVSKSRCTLLYPDFLKSRMINQGGSKDAIIKQIIRYPIPFKKFNKHSKDKIKLNLSGNI